MKWKKGEVKKNEGMLMDEYEKRGVERLWEERKR